METGKKKLPIGIENFEKFPRRSLSVRHTWANFR